MTVNRSKAMEHRATSLALAALIVLGLTARARTEETNERPPNISFGLVGTLGTLLMINGYTLAVEIPFMA